MKHFFKIILLLFFTQKSLAQTQSGEITLEKNIMLYWETEVFNQSKHQIEVCKTELGTDYICEIDKKPWYGSDMGTELPKDQLTKLSLYINYNEIELDITGMFNAGYLSKEQFLLKKEGDFFKLYAYFSDGAGTYTAHWSIINKSSIREVISKDEEYFSWQIGK